MEALNGTDQDRALLALLERLEAEAYHFVPTTPLTHRRILRRRQGELGSSFRDILGWNLPFIEAPHGLVDMLSEAGRLTRVDGRLKSTIRVARLHGRLFVHSAFPTDEEDAVFLGPDSYRFADLIERELTGTEQGLIVDIGGGCGAGALTAAGLAPAARVLITDVNAAALRLARINAAHSGLSVETLETPALDAVVEAPQVVIANPPYMAGADETYADGGGRYGGQASVEWVRSALEKLAPGGRLILYTGSAIPRGGDDPLLPALMTAAGSRATLVDYREIDPDVFGEELETEAYRDVERIAVVSCVIRLV